MPTRFFRRRTQPFRKVFTRRRPTAVVAGGQTKRVWGSSSRNVPIYTYQRASVAHRRLIHVWPQVSQVRPLSLNNTFSVTPTAPAVNPTAILLNAVYQGDGLEARHANKIYMNEVVITWSLGASVAAGVSDIPFNVAVIYDRDTRGTVPNIFDIFDQTDTLTMQRISNRERFDIIYRADPSSATQRVYTGSLPVNSYVSADQARHRSIKVPINRNTVYTGPGTITPPATVPVVTTADILKGSLYLFVWNNSPPAADNILFYCATRMTFTDIE